MTREEIRLRVAISVIQGVLEAKHGVIGEVVPSVAVAIALRIADAFVEEWYREIKEKKPGEWSEEEDKIWINTDTLNGYYMSNHPLCGEEYIRKNALLEYLKGKMTVEEATEGIVGGYNLALKDVIKHIESL